MDHGGDAFEREIDRLSELRLTGRTETFLTYAGTYASGDRQRAVELRAVRASTVDGDTTDQFVYNAQNWRKAATHPNIVELLDWGTDPRPWVLLDNSHVDDFETVRHGLDTATACALIDDVAEALRNAALYNVAHLDLRPSVIQLTDDDPPEAQVGDWGVARAVATRQGEYVTPYTAPEQLDDDSTASAAVTDVYGLGGLAYFALTGHRPYPADREAILTGNLTVPSVRNPDLPDEADTVVAQALSHDPSDRPQSALRFAEQFRRVTDALDSSSAATGGVTGSQTDAGGSERGDATTQAETPQNATGGPDEQASATGERHQQGEDTSGWSRRALLLAFGTGVASTAAGAYALTEPDLQTTIDATTDGASSSGDRDDEPSEPDADTEVTTAEVSGPVRIGMVQPLSGPQRIYGNMAVRGFYTYFGYRGADIPSEISQGRQEFEVGNTTYVLDLRDGGSEQAETQAVAEELADEVTVLVGGMRPASARAIANNVAEPRNIPYMAGPTDAVDLTASSDNCSQTVFRASETVAMESVAGGQYLANERDDIDSVHIYHADYAYGEAIRETYQRVLTDNGVTVADTGTLSLDDNDWIQRFEEAERDNADAVVSGRGPTILPEIIVAYLTRDYDFRLISSWGPRRLAQILGTAVREAFGEDFTAADIRESGLGPFPSRYHWNQYDNRIARQANQVHREAYGTNTDIFTSGMFTAAAALVQAVEQSGSADRSDIVTELTGMRVQDTLKGNGAYEFQEYNNQARSPMTVASLVPGGVDGWDAPIQPGEPLATYSRDGTTPPASRIDCNLG